MLLAAGLQDWVDLGVIVGLLLLNAVIGFAQDFQAGNIVKVEWSCYFLFNWNMSHA